MPIAFDDIILPNFTPDFTSVHGQGHNPIVKTTNLGNGTTAGGGSPCTSAGNVVAFGCTEEHLLATIFGVKQRGQPNLAGWPARHHAFVHDTGEGYVKAKQGHYHDALSVKQNTVIALVAEPFGGVTAFTHRVLTRLAKEATDGRNGTVYLSMAHFSTDSYYQHHAGAISMVVVKSAAEALEKGIIAIVLA